MSYDTSLSGKIATVFVGVDEPSNYQPNYQPNYQRNSAFKYLNKIYTVKGEGENVGSVFFEFKESEPCTKKYDYMTRVFKEINKSPDFCPDDRIPKEAKRGFCFGIRGNGAQSLEDLIEKVEYWVTWGELRFAYPVQVISVDPSMLTFNLCKMPAKNYDKIYPAENGGCYIPVHLLNPNYEPIPKIKVSYSTLYSMGIPGTSFTAEPSKKAEGQTTHPLEKSL